MTGEPNDLLRAARERCPSPTIPGTYMSRRELAESVAAWLFSSSNERYDLDVRLVAKWERGAVRYPSAPYRAALRAVLGAPNDEALGFHATASAAGHGGGVAPTRNNRLPVESAADLSDEVLANAADESSAFLSWAEVTNIGELTVEQMHTDIRRIAGAYLKSPTAPLFARAKALRDHAFTLLAGRQAPRQTRELYAVAGWSLTLLAWISVDLGHSDAARDHARAAWLCAERADYHALRAWVRATQHTAAFWNGEYTAAANFAADGLTYTSTPNSSVTGGGTAALFLSGALALDLARNGQHDAAHAALRHAHRIAESSASTDELSGPFTCTLDRAGSLWSDTELVLGAADKALVAATDAVAAFEATPAERRNWGSERMTRIQQVKAYLLLGDDAAAWRALEPVPDTDPHHRVRPLMHRLREVSVMALDSGRSGSSIAAIRGSVAAFTAPATTKSITSGVPVTDA